MILGKDRYQLLFINAALANWANHRLPWLLHPFVNALPAVEVAALCDYRLLHGIKTYITFEDTRRVFAPLRITALFLLFLLFFLFACFTFFRFFRGHRARYLWVGGWPRGFPLAHHRRRLVPQKVNTTLASGGVASLNIHVRCVLGLKDWLSLSHILGAIRPQTV